MLSNEPETYTIPTIGTIPRQLNVSLLKDAPNIHAVYSSKVRYPKLQSNTIKCLL